MTELLVIAIAVSLFFAFWNGFTDAANAISTIVATRVLTPVKAVGLAAMGNFLGLYAGGEVAKTIWTGLIQSDLVWAGLVLAAILGGLAWDVITWYFGLPVSETHVLIGALVGAGLFVGGVQAIQFGSVVQKVLLPMVYGPFLAFVLAFLFTALIARFFRRYSPAKVNKHFGRAQIASSFFFSFSHGAQDGQKVVGILLGILAFEGLYRAGQPTPIWIIPSVQVALSLGTLLGGWRIVKTMAMKITKLRPYQGFSAEAGGAIINVGLAQIGFPISTTHSIGMAIVGTGSVQRFSAVRWGVARRIIWTWILTFPASIVFAYLVMGALTLGGVLPP